MLQSRAVDLTTGGLDPEEANTYNVGMIIATDELAGLGTNIGAFSLSVDYYIIDFEKTFTGEAPLPVFSVMFRGSNNPASWDCGNDLLRARLTFTPPDSPDSTSRQNDDRCTFPSCHPNNLAVIAVQNINGTGVAIRGIDIAVSWTLPGVLGGDIEIGANSSYMMRHRRSVVTLVGTSFVTEPAIDLADTSELLSAFPSFPRWRNVAYLRFAIDEHNVRWDTHYYAGTKDRNAANERRDSQMLHDLSYRRTLSKYNLTLTGTVANVLDSEPRISAAGSTTTTRPTALSGVCPRSGWSTRSSREGPDPNGSNSWIQPRLSRSLFTNLCSAMAVMKASTRARLTGVV